MTDTVTPPKMTEEELRKFQELLKIQLEQIESQKRKEHKEQTTAVVPVQTLPDIKVFVRNFKKHIKNKSLVSKKFIKETATIEDLDKLDIDNQKLIEDMKALLPLYEDKPKKHQKLLKLQNKIFDTDIQIAQSKKMLEMLYPNKNK